MERIAVKGPCSRFNAGTTLISEMASPNTVPPCAACVSSNFFIVFINYQKVNSPIPCRTISGSPSEQSTTVEGSMVPFSREIYIERGDFMEEPPKKFFRLSPGKEVRLRYSYIIRCDEVVKDADGNVVELRCSYDTESKGGGSSDGRKVKGIIHWV